MVGKQRILVAGARDAVQTARLILGEGFDYRFAFSLEEAQAELGPGVELILCHARMLELLDAVRADAQCGQKPLVCFHAHGWEMGADAYQRTQLALETFANARFVDLYAIARSSGIPAAGAALRHAVRSAMQ